MINYLLIKRVKVTIRDGEEIRDEFDEFICMDDIRIVRRQEISEGPYKANTAMWIASEGGKWIYTMTTMKDFVNAGQITKQLD